MSKMKDLTAKYGPKAVGMWLNFLALFFPRKAAQKTLDIFCTPRGGRVRSHQQKFLRKFDKEVVTCGEGDIMTYHSPGDGPRILLCHGWESNTFRWRKLYKSLKVHDLDVVAMDAPAHGDTGASKFTAVKYAAMMEAVCDRYKPDILCGHSVGGMAAIIALHKYKLSTIKKAIILAAPDRLTDITDNYFKLIGGSGRLRKYYDETIFETFGHPTSYYSAASFAEELTIPALIIHDKDDTINKYEEGLRIHQAWSESKLKTTRGQGHSLQSEQVYGWVTEFCNTTRKATPQVNL